jgi:hypothetical protein
VARATRGTLEVVERFDAVEPGARCG